MEQREEMSAQMTQMLLSRVLDFKETVQAFQGELEKDVDGLSISCTSKLEHERKVESISNARLAKSEEMRQDLPIHVPTSLTATQKSKMTRVHSSRTLFSSDVESRKLRPRNSLNSIEHSRERLELEKKLFLVADEHAARSIEDFKVESPLFNCETALILELVETIVQLPKDRVSKAFERAMRSNAVRKLFESLFWFLVASIFLPGEVEFGKARRKQLALDFVNFVKFFEENVQVLRRDAIHRCLAFCLAKGVLLGLSHLFPGSRHLFSVSKRSEIWIQSAQLLLGESMSVLSVERLRSQLFPEDAPIVSMNQDDEKEKVLESGAAERMNTNGTGPLLSKNLQRVFSIERPSSAFPHFVKRSVPKRRRTVGPLSTEVDDYSRKYVQSRAELERYKVKLKVSFLEKARKVETERKQVLQNGEESIGRFCLDLTQKMRVRQPSAGLSRPSNYLQGEKRLDWHANLEIHRNLPVADRIILARDRIEARRRSEQRRLRTKARSLLLPLQNH